jgi:hypothetical protein
MECNVGRQRNVYWIGQLVDYWYSFLYYPWWSTEGQKSNKSGLKNDSKETLTLCISSFEKFTGKG